MGEILLRRTTATALILLVAVIGGRHYQRIQWSLAVQSNEAAVERQREANASRHLTRPTAKIMPRVRHSHPRTQRQMLKDIRTAAIESKRLAAEHARRQSAVINPL